MTDQSPPTRAQAALSDAAVKTGRQRLLDEIEEKLRGLAFLAKGAQRPDLEGQLLRVAKLVPLVERECKACTRDFMPEHWSQEECSLACWRETHGDA